MATVADRRDDLEKALAERAKAQRHFDEVIGTSMEMTAYQRLRRAGRRLSAVDAAVRSSESESDEAPLERV